MAQIDLGSIKFNWKGSYSGATAYVVDDVVESSGSSYICIAATTGNAPPNATYWEQMSSAGTNGTDGTDLTTTLTTQGDIVYRDGSGLQRLGAGTSGQVLQTGGTGANPSWVDASGGKTLGITELSNLTRTALSTSSNILLWSTSYTQIKANSKLKFDIHLHGFNPQEGALNMRFSYDGTNYDGYLGYTYHGSPWQTQDIGNFMLDGSATTGSKTIEIRSYPNDGQAVRPYTVFNPNSSDDSRLAQTRSTIIITEYDF